MLNKVMQSKLKAESRKPTEKTASEKLKELREYKRRGTRNATKEARRLKLGDLAYSKPSDHDTGMNYGIDARKARKQNLTPANKVKKDSDLVVVPLRLVVRQTRLSIVITAISAAITCQRIND